MLNSISLVGRTTKEIELRVLNNNTYVTSFSLAQNRKVNGNEVSDYFDCVAYGKTAELLGQYVKKGHKVGVTGRLQTRTWTDDKGANRKVVEILVNDIELLEPKQNNQYQPQQGYQNNNYNNGYQQQAQQQNAYQQPYNQPQQSDPFASAYVNRDDLPF